MTRLRALSLFGDRLQADALFAKSCSQDEQDTRWGRDVRLHRAALQCEAPAIGYLSPVAF
jgi:hypothetical protein